MSDPTDLLLFYGSIAVVAASWCFAGYTRGRVVESRRWRAAWDKVADSAQANYDGAGLKAMVDLLGLVVDKKKVKP